MLNTPFQPWPYFSPDEIDAVSAVLKSGRVNYWTGTEGRDFEKAFASWCGVEHAVALHNGTLALEACWRALELAPAMKSLSRPARFLRRLPVFSMWGRFRSLPMWNRTARTSRLKQQRGF